MIFDSTFVIDGQHKRKLIGEFLFHVNLVSGFSRGVVPELYLDHAAITVSFSDFIS